MLFVIDQDAAGRVFKSPGGWEIVLPPDGKLAFAFVIITLRVKHHDIQFI